MKPKRPEIEDAVPLLQHSLFLQFGKRALDRVGKACRDIQRMMTGQNAAELQLPYLLHGPPKPPWVSRRIKGVELTNVEQIARKQIPALLLIKTAMSGRMSGRVDNRKLPAAQVQAVAVVQKVLRPSAENSVIRRTEGFRGTRRDGRSGFVSPFPAATGTGPISSPVPPHERQRLQTPRSRRYDPNAHA